MKNAVIVRDYIRVSDYFHLDILMEDLLKRKEKVITEFIDKYKDFLFDEDDEKLVLKSNDAEILFSTEIFVSK